MSIGKIIGILIVYAIGAAASCAWAISLDATPLLGFLLWTSFYGFCNAVTWALF